MNVLYYLNKFPVLSQSFVLSEIVELERRGHDVAVFALNDSEEDVTRHSFEDLDIRVRYADTPDYGNILDTIDRRLLEMSLPANLSREPDLRRLGIHAHLALQCLDFTSTLESDIDIVHGHFANHAKFPARYVANYREVPLTLTAHAFEIFASDQRGQAANVLQTADRVVTPSKYNREFLRDALEVTRPIDVVYATVDIDQFSPTAAERPYRLLTVARLVEKKGYEYGLRAVAGLVDEFPDLEYHIVGKGPLEQELRELIDDLSLDEHVTMLGHVTDDRLERELDEAAVFLLPCVVAEDGDRDVIPVSLKEAMAMETACISTTVAGVPELIADGENGVLVPQRDSEALERSIRRLLESPETRWELAEAGRRTVENTFTIETAVDALLETFTEAIDGRVDVA